MNLYSKAVLLIRNKLNVPDREVLELFGCARSSLVWALAIRELCLWISVSVLLVSAYADAVFNFESLPRSGAVLVAFAIYCAFSNSQIMRIVLRARIMEQEGMTLLLRAKSLGITIDLKAYQESQEHISNARESLENFHYQSYSLETFIAIVGTLIWGFGDLANF